MLRWLVNNKCYFSMTRYARHHRRPYLLFTLRKHRKAVFSHNMRYFVF
jgi:hypothetical protein